MLNKIIKRGQRKVAKSDVDLAAAVSRGRISGGASPSNIIVVNQNWPPPPRKLSTESQPFSAPIEPIENLPMFRDVSSVERPNLFRRKAKICSYVFDFSDQLKMAREKEIKRQTLVELVDFIRSNSGKITESNQNEMVQMIGFNLFRCLPPASHENTGSDNLDPDEEAPYSEPSWPHLQFIYELLLRYVVSSDTDTKIAKRYIDSSFVLKLLDLFDSEDPREREYLKTIVHRIYGRFMVHRPFIRKAMNDIFYRFIYETGRFNGIAELLEIMGSIINGYALPMKEEHKLFLIRVLVPLHKPKAVAGYHQDLSHCVRQFVEKDFKLADKVINGLLKYWPATNCQKEVLFLEELEEVLMATQIRGFQNCMVPLFRQIAGSISSPHFQVAERGLLLWNNEHIVRLISDNRDVILPIIFDALEQNIRCHWNPLILGLTVNVRKMFLDMDAELFDECQREYAESLDKLKEYKEQREIMWNEISAKLFLVK